ncbi:hypothetical protein ACOMHN_054757 [Nucella lapillus]
MHDINCIRRFLSMGYLPVAVVRQNFQQFCASRGTQRLIRRYPELRDFILYLERNYSDGNFPPLMWNVYNRNSDTLTHAQTTMWKLSIRDGTRLWVLDIHHSGHFFAIRRTHRPNWSFERMLQTEEIRVLPASEEVAAAV